MRVVVTGAAGAIGRYVVADLAARGHTIVAVDRVAPGAADPGTGGRSDRVQAPELVAAMDAPLPDPSVVTWRIGDSRDEALHARQSLPPLLTSKAARAFAIGSSRYSSLYFG